MSGARCLLPAAMNSLRARRQGSRAYVLRAGCHALLAGRLGSRLHMRRYVTHVLLVAGSFLLFSAYFAHVSSMRKRLAIHIFTFTIGC